MAGYRAKFIPRFSVECVSAVGRIFFPFFPDLATGLYNRTCAVGTLFTMKWKRCVNVLLRAFGILTMKQFKFKCF